MFPVSKLHVMSIFHVVLKANYNRLQHMTLDLEILIM